MEGCNPEEEHKARREMLYHMLHAQSRLVRAGKDSAMPHFIAIVKALEESFAFEFVPLEE